MDDRIMIFEPTPLGLLPDKVTFVITPAEEPRRAEIAREVVGYLASKQQVIPIGEELQWDGSTSRVGDAELGIELVAQQIFTPGNAYGPWHPIPDDDIPLPTSTGHLRYEMRVDLIEPEPEPMFGPE